MTLLAALLGLALFVPPSLAELEARLDAVDARLAAPPPQSANAAFVFDCARELEVVERALEALPMSDAVRDRGWIRLRRVEAGLLPQLNTIAMRAPIPLVFDNGHDAAARRWIRLSAAGLDVGRGVLHIDSHPDVGGLPEPSRLLATLDALRKNPEDRAAGRSLDALVTDVNHPLAVAALLGATGQVWVKPAWAVVRGEHRVGLVLAADEAATVDRPLCPRGGLCFHLDPTRTPPDARARLSAGLADVTEADLGEWNRPPPRAFARPVDLTILEVSRPGLAGTIAEALPPGRFLFSIDLDFFSTNGLPGQSGNPCSAGRVDRACAGEPGDATSRQAAWEAEVRAVDERLRAFAALVRGLAATGRRPSLISLADSSFLQGSRSPEHDDVNDFTPPDLVSRIRHGVVRALAAAWPDVGAGSVFAP